MTPQHGIGRSIPAAGRRRLAGASLALFLSLAASSCTPPDPTALLKVTEVETYWVLDPSRTEKRFLAPAVRFRVENISQETLLSVDATAAFHREGTSGSWGSGFFRLTEGRKRLEPGEKVLVTMSSDARYTLEGAPEAAFVHPTFKPLSTVFFLRVGSSGWVEFGKSPVENVIGSKDARALLSQSK
jgi:hypothetical protein